MLDHEEYTIGNDGYQGNGNGYDHLEDDWALFYRVAKGFTHRVKREDKEDFLHDLILAMARVKAKCDQIGKPLREAGLVRVACYERAQYWRKWYKRINGIDCSQCSQRQREKCKDWYLYPDCPKAIKMERLDELVEDGNGDSTPLHEFIADDSAVDLVAMVDAKNALNGYPHSFVQLAYKKYAGYPLNNEERAYLYRQKRKAQKSLALA